MLLELCVTELEDVESNSHNLKRTPQPVVQESSHPYIDDVNLTGHVRIPGRILSSYSPLKVVESRPARSTGRVKKKVASKPETS